MTRCCSARGLSTSTKLARTVHGFADAALAELARESIRGSAAPSDVRERLLRGVDDWLAPTPPPPPPLIMQVITNPAVIMQFITDPRGDHASHG